ncbi:MAG: hypothetical protein UY62_C0023G0005 [Parcubacteria group bacterium GW2011_GWF2_50_9]|nr:MAG: hypothetical protein UY62_C0023G0005 [Parcubacteria group bacterium GW2011_GWF2_50_9]
MIPLAVKSAFVPLFPMDFEDRSFSQSRIVGCTSVAIFICLPIWCGAKASGDTGYEALEGRIEVGCLNSPYLIRGASAAAERGVIKGTLPSPAHADASVGRSAGRISKSSIFQAFPKKKTAPLMRAGNNEHFIESGEKW